MVMVYFDKEVMLVSCVRSLTNLITLVLIMIIYISDLITMHFLLSAHQAIIWFWLHQFTEDRGYVNSSKSIVCLKYFEICWGTGQVDENASGTQQYNSHVCHSKNNYNILIVVTFYPVNQTFWKFSCILFGFVSTQTLNLSTNKKIKNVHNIPKFRGNPCFSNILNIFEIILFPLKFKIWMLTNPDNLEGKK